MEVKRVFHSLKPTEPRKLRLFYEKDPAQRRFVDCVWNMMAHAQKPDFFFRRNGWVHLNRQGRQFSRLMATEMCASAVVMLDTPFSEVVKGPGYPLHSLVSPSLSLPCVTVCHHVSIGLYILVPIFVLWEQRLKTRVKCEPQEHEIKDRALKIWL